jgi:twitching motility protein PilT
MAINFGQLLTNMEKINASDLHIKSGCKPIYRINGKLVPINHPAISKEEVTAIVNKILPEKLQERLKKEGSCDFAFSIDATTRFRTNAFYQKGTLSIALRRLQYQDLSFERLGLPIVLNNICKYKRGMILITGPTGTGKSTTMAAILENINSTRAEHIITIEDPIEFVFLDKMSVIEQREIGIDARSFDESLRHALRQDPDVILIGEMRDRETIQIAIRAAMTGHLVISTLHTINAVHTVSRIVKYFPPEEQASLRNELATCLKSVISQRLIETVEKKNRVPCMEVMIVNDTVRKLIRENRIEDIEQIIRNGQDDMQSFDLSLSQLVKEGKISMETGEEYADDIPGFRRLCKGVASSTDRSGILAGF